MAWILYAERNIFGIPKGQPRAGSSWNHKGRHDTGTASAWRLAIRDGFADLARSQGEPLDEPVRVDIVFYFKRPAKLNRRTRDAYGGKSKFIPAGPVLHTSKPDRDNAEKAVLDALTDVGLWRDDSLVCDGWAAKRYASESGRTGAQVKIYRWEHDHG